MHCFPKIDLKWIGRGARIDFIQFFNLHHVWIFVLYELIIVLLFSDNSYSDDVHQLPFYYKVLIFYSLCSINKNTIRNNNTKQYSFWKTKMSDVKNKLSFDNVNWLLFYVKILISYSPFTIDKNATLNSNTISR